MLHPHTQLAFIDDTIGHGIVANKLIKKGTITWVLDDLDMEFSSEQVDKMSPEKQNYIHTYSYRNNKGNSVLCWDHSRFVNHSFRSNCLSTAYDFEIAIRDILPGEQLTDDYGYLNVESIFEPIDEGTERKLVRPDDLVNFHQEWDEELLEVFPLIANVNQPLRHLFTDGKWKEMLRIANEDLAMESILTNYFNGQ